MISCIALVYKEAGSEDGRVCGEQATCVMRLTDSGTGEVIEAAPLCERHATSLETGHSVMVRYSLDDVVLLRGVDLEGGA